MNTESPKGFLKSGQEWLKQCLEQFRIRPQTQASASGLKNIKILITAVFVLLMLVHIIWPNLGIDLVTICLVLLAMLPWILPIVSKLELPGGIKIELRDVKSATDKMGKQVTLEIKDAVHGHRAKPVKLEVTSAKEAPFVFLRSVAAQDPNLAFVAIRVEIEKRLRALAEVYDFRPKAPLKIIVRRLQAEKVLSDNFVPGLVELITLGNNAAHGAEVAPEAAEWVLDMAPSILDELDKLIARSKGGTPEQSEG